MSNEIKINKHDYNRVVLTEVQPYELPFIVTNEGFYSFIGSCDGSNFLALLFGHLKETRPYDFKIVKSSDTFRKLSLIHPFGQVKFTDFYRKYHSLIKSKCENSNFSLRYPVDTALYYIESDQRELDSQLKDEGVDLHTDHHELTPIYASSFFTYKKYNFLYKFYDSYVFHRIERKFNKLHKFDISKCFENLSTDMLPSALRGEDLLRSEINSTQSFESQFSALASFVNYGRNHGIVVGPEFSRIYAEILLQRIDSVIESSLSQKNIRYGKDYVIKRYVDDYFLFYNDENLLKPIKQCVTDNLSEYKLFLNESKDEHLTRPFVTGVTSAKLSIREYYNDLFGKLSIGVNSSEIATSSSFFNYSRLSNRYITQLKVLVDKHDVCYESISGYFLTILRRKVNEINEVFTISVVDSKTSSAISRFLLLIVEVMFFIYSMDSRVRATYLISEIIIQISEIAKKFDYESEIMISDKIVQEAKFSIKNAPQTIDNVESLNLALSLQTLNTENSLSVGDIRNLLNIKLTDKIINYFQLVVGLYIIKNNPDYYTLKIDLCEKALYKISLSKNPFQDSDIVHMIFDIVSCPFLTKKHKKVFINKLVNLNVIPSSISEDQFYDKLSNNSWFVDWSELSIKRLLKKKQLRSPY
ncbi:MAG: antiviral reverse transcriptase Drt3b [Psychromonas sp.]